MVGAISLLALGFEGWGREVLSVDLRLIRTECTLCFFIPLDFKIYSEHTLSVGIAYIELGDNHGTTIV